MNSAKRNMITCWRACLCILLMIFFMSLNASAQRKYFVQNGRMYIALDKNLKEPSLDSFITQYDLGQLALKRFLSKDFKDSLLMQGWRIDMNTAMGVLISKELFAPDNIFSPADKILLTEKHPTFAERFPATNNGIVFGYNRFRNKLPFAKKDSFVTFYLRGYKDAGKVMLAGSFNDWNPNNLPMQRTDSGWIAMVKLGPGKFWYKFIADGNWMTDMDNSTRENDGLGNTNSVYFNTNTVFRLNGYTDARAVYLAGSFNNWRERDLAMKKTETGWELPLYLADGTHTYRFIVDGKWMADENNPDKLPNEFNEYNSVIRKGPQHLFRLNGYENAGTVILSGDFNEWRKNELLMKKANGGWEIKYNLGGGNYVYKFIVDGKEIIDPANPLTAQSGKFVNSYLIIDPNYTFRLKGYPNAKMVFLAGDFNGWSPNSLLMKKDGGDWIFSVHLSIGKHLYKFVVDGKWINDPSNKLYEQNEFRTGNSVIWIDK